MRLRTIFMSMLVIAALTSCNNDDVDHHGGPQMADVDVAYLSIKIETQPTTRASGSTERPGTNESDLKTLYLITFDENGMVVGIPGTTNYFTMLSTSSTTPEAIKVSKNAKQLLVIANPDGMLKNAINNISVTSSFSSINATITGTTKDEVIDNPNSISKGFTMINSGPDKEAEGKVTNLLIDISNSLKDNENEAEDNRVPVSLERLAAKLDLQEKPDGATTKQEGASFTFGRWTLDAVNSTYFPCAEKQILGSTHAQNIYKKNFYTYDPNFNGASGLVFATINTDNDYSPLLAESYNWQNKGTTAYCIENTMDAADQLFGNATRLVIQATYFPSGFNTQGDWFNYAGKNYDGLKKLQEAYSEAGEGSNLKKACDKMFNKIKTYANEHPGIIISGVNFASLTEEDLSKIPNGGQVIKEGKDDVIRWYQKGLCYYYYMIRHDNTLNDEMVFGKYGVVRNNWYSLTLNSVGGPGSPWYPEANNPGPGDPDPKDPIDEAAGYLGITVSVAPWIVWENEIDI